MGWEFCTQPSEEEAEEGVVGWEFCTQPSAEEAEEGVVGCLNFVPSRVRRKWRRGWWRGNSIFVFELFSFLESRE